MHIAIFSKELPSDHPNGVSIQVDRLARALVHRGHDVQVYSFSPKPATAPYEHVQFSHRLLSPLGRLLDTALTFRSAAKSCNADVLHFHGDDWLVRGTRRRVRTFHGSAFYEARYATSTFRKLRQAFLYLCEIVSSLRKGTLTSVSASAFRVLPRKGTVIPCSVPLDKYHCAGDRSAHPSILFIGDLDSRKRGRLLCGAFIGVVRKTIPNAELVVVGPQEVQGPGIRWAGVIDEESLICEYSKAWALCVPSSYEGFGVPAIEAMACGVPVVAVPTAGSIEVVENEVSGIFVSDVDIGNVLSKLLLDSERRKQLIVGGHIAAARFDADIVAGHYEKLYNSAAGSA